ncbi:endonuclease MutS2 [Chryseomicrobium excrementi]|uniref:Endonuclease MutS2 n=1 Tax=Chryseomicrobium excrementi TaxID=2041346 RepID=A0A2M9F1V3_9BACL|nr:endonuclease MutS2 [Chryseomicrobium excrementi]PJK17432.1 endonuclease MutS2 [Chryseomicrobium excrementi]
MIAKKALHTLEYPKVIDHVKSFATSSVGKTLIEELVPLTDFEQIQTWTEETDEALAILRVRGNVPLGGLFDVRPHARRAQIGGILSAMELMEIASTIRSSKILRRFIEDVTDAEDFSTKHMKQYTDGLPVLTELEHEINACIDDNGMVLDSASQTLRSIRQQLRTAVQRIREKLDSYTRGQNATKMLSDAIVTIRNDRYVIPVKAEYRSHYGGIVHDQSSSGQTLFIEPNAVVQLNNDARALRVKEQEEIERILKELSMQVELVASDLFHLVKTMATLDAIFAKAKYGTAEKCTRPTINREGRIRLVKARHPLIKKEEAVANTIEFGNPDTAVVITGPNTGGKTVTLKTVGLSTLMAQSGIPIPALDGSEIAVFESVFADIGDEQSIEQSLSTFSSHMVNIVDILKKFDEHSLVLFDELGAGTDPQEGAALAISILDEVHGRGARVMATTHYPELKAYGYNRPGVINASVEFDVETLSPTYKLLMGVPGRSNAFEISKRLGLPQHIITHAEGFTGTDRGEVDTMIASLEESRKRAEQDAEETKRVLEESEALKQELAERLADYEAKKEQLAEKAREKAKKIVDEARRESETVIQELRQLQKQAAAGVKEHEIIDARKRLEGALPENPVLKKEKQKKQRAQNLQAGDEVKVLSFGQKGTLLEKVSKDEWAVQIGVLKMKLPESDLEFVKPDKPQPTVSVHSVGGRSGAGVKLELDLRGERYEDALLRTEKYLDDAVLANYPRVSIIHGKGTGALRQGIQTMLKKDRRVKSYRFGEAGEGGYGVTIVELK